MSDKPVPDKPMSAKSTTAKSTTAKTLYDKLWESHLVKERDDGTALIYIDLQLIHEVTSPQAFDGLRLAGRRPWRRDANLATPDHNVPTTLDERRIGIDGIVDPVSKIQVMTLGDNCREFDLVEFDINDGRQGIVHDLGVLRVVFNEEDLDACVFHGCQHHR